MTGMSEDQSILVNVMADITQPFSFVDEDYFRLHVRIIVTTELFSVMVHVEGGE